MIKQKFIVPDEARMVALMTIRKDWREHKFQKREVIDIEDDLEQALANYPEDVPYDQWEVVAEQCTTSEYKNQINASEVNLTVLFGPERSGRVKVMGFGISSMVYNIVQHSTVFLTLPMEGYSLPVPSPDKGGGKKIKIHGIGYLEENNYCNNEQFSVSGKIPSVKLSLKRGVQFMFDCVSDLTTSPDNYRCILADDMGPDGLTDNKIHGLELVEELRAKRADKQSTFLLDAFNKYRTSLPQPLLNPPPLAPLPVLAPPDLRTQEMIIGKLKKAKDLGQLWATDYSTGTLAIGAFHAMQKGILTSNVAGNSGPYLGSVCNIAS
ncbi:hypothetical protein GIB67_000326 [Kingdonia uniflora]|uniref:Uncharacterized protein n=1 Tax=Kingdonia uniflora TaxID=39325 RepID=A0A7J7LCG8_9MAGN|nr:hypothetical protein GIB67_000326 [Kingdonia uniflora]